MKNIITTAVFLLAGLFAAAQELRTPQQDSIACIKHQWQIAPRVGYDFSTNLNKNARYLETKPAITAGLGIDHYWANRWYGVGLDVDYYRNPTAHTMPDQALEYRDPLGVAVDTVNFRDHKEDLQRFFVGIGPSFRYPFKECCSRWSAELNLRAGITFLKGAKYHGENYTENILVYADLYDVEAYDQTPLTAKAQLRFSYFFSPSWGLHLGGYFTNAFDVKTNDIVYRTVNNRLQISYYNDWSEQTKGNLFSYGAFAGISWRHCQRRITPPRTEFTFIGKVLDAKTQRPITHAKLTLKEVATAQTTPYEVDKNGELRTPLSESKGYELVPEAEGYLPAEPFILTPNTYIAENNRNVKHTFYLTKRIIPNYVLTGKVVESETQAILANAVVTVEGAGTTLKLKTNAEGVYSTTLKINENYQIAATAPECLPSEKTKVMNPDAEKEPVVTRDFILQKVRKNEVIRLNNIHYDYNRATIRPDAEPELNRLLQYLEENPTVRVEMSSHTDSRGSDSYNLRLSQNRANAVKDYLVGKGINANRIKSVGYGETKLLNHCKNSVECTEEQHEENRRTEMKLIE